MLYRRAYQKTVCKTSDVFQIRLRVFLLPCNRTFAEKNAYAKDSLKVFGGREGEFESCVECWINLAKRGGVYAFENANVSILKTDEKKQLASFFSALGKTDLKDQLSHVGYYKNLFEQKQKVCEDESKKLGNTYFKLCVLAGIAIMLILA